ncbi:uncharacterized protein ACO6RY_14524 [Pungitius sinensis]
MTTCSYFYRSDLISSPSAFFFLPCFSCFKPRTGRSGGPLRSRGDVFNREEPVQHEDQDQTLQDSVQGETRNPPNQARKLSLESHWNSEGGSCLSVFPSG